MGRAHIDTRLIRLAAQPTACQRSVGVRHSPRTLKYMLNKVPPATVKSWVAPMNYFILNSN